MRKATKQFLDLENKMRAVMKQPPLIIGSKEMLDFIENALSPENLACDGEASFASMRYHSQVLNDLKRECLASSSDRKEHKVGDMIFFQNKEYKVIIVNNVNYRIVDSQGKQYNLRKTFDIK